MVDELRSERHKLSNLIGCKGAVNVTSCQFTKELIASLDGKYKQDQTNAFRLHQLELLYELVQNARAEGKSLHQMQNEFRVKPEEIDDWNDMISLNRIYFVLEHPNALSLNSKRRIKKKPATAVFTPEDYIEWRVEQHFRLKGLELWARNQINARKLALKSEFDFEELLHGHEWSQLQDLHEICDPPERKPYVLSEKQKMIRKMKQPPLKLTDDSIEDWTESYSEESDESDEGDTDFVLKRAADDQKAKEEAEQFQYVSDLFVSSSSSSEADEDKLFTGPTQFPKYKYPIFEDMDREKSTKRWLDLLEEVSSQIGSASEEEEGEASKEEIGDGAEDVEKPSQEDRGPKDMEDKEDRKSSNLEQVAEESEASDQRSDDSKSGEKETEEVSDSVDREQPSTEVAMEEKEKDVDDDEKLSAEKVTEEINEQRSEASESVGKDTEEIEDSYDQEQPSTEVEKEKSEDDTEEMFSQNDSESMDLDQKPEASKSMDMDQNPAVSEPEDLDRSPQDSVLKDMDQTPEVELKDLDQNPEVSELEGLDQNPEVSESKAEEFLEEPESVDQPTEEETESAEKDTEEINDSSDQEQPSAEVQKGGTEEK